MFRQVIIVTGPSGVGKSTLAQELIRENPLNTTIIDADLHMNTELPGALSNEYDVVKLRTLIRQGRARSILYFFGLCQNMEEVISTIVSCYQGTSVKLCVLRATPEAIIARRRRRGKPFDLALTPAQHAADIESFYKFTASQPSGLVPEMIDC